MEEQEPETLLNLLREAHLLHLRGQFEPAAEKCRAALEQDDRNWEARELLGDILRDRGDPAAAIVEYRAALALAPTEGKLEEKIARASLLQAELGRAVESPEALVPSFLTTRKPGIAAMLSAVTGLGQIYNGQFIKGAILLVVEITLVVLIGLTSATVVKELQGSRSPLAQFAPLVAPFVDSRVLPWTILAGLGWFYGVIDAAVVAARPAERRAPETTLLP